MAANSKTDSLERCLMSLENTLKSKTTGDKFKSYIEEKSGSLRNDHILAFDFLVECLEILSDKTSATDKLANAKKLVNGKAIKGSPPKVLINLELRKKLLNPADVTQLEGAVREVFDLNARSSIGEVFDSFVAGEHDKKPKMCGGNCQS